MSRVVVAMSGGIDSSFSALWLKSKGYEVIGVSYIFADNSGIERAKVVAKALGIPHFTLDLKEEFQREIIEPFIKGYDKGTTPNPCALCNKKIKFGLAMDLALRETRASHYATGHYARLSLYGSYPVLTLPKNLRKDQTYFLALLPSSCLPKLIFPLGEIEEKTLALKALQEIGLNLWRSAVESQDVCFLKGVELKSYLSKYLKASPGELIYKGQVIGHHEGYQYYTIGQRKGLGVRKGRPLYVAKISPKGNRLYLAEKGELFKQNFLVSQLNAHIPITLWESPLAQVRYRGEKAKILDFKRLDSAIQTLEGELEQKSDLYLVKLNKGLFAITPGQICAFYQDKHLLGGALIETTL